MNRRSSVSLITAILLSTSLSVLAAPSTKTPSAAAANSATETSVRRAAKLLLNAPFTATEGGITAINGYGSGKVTATQKVILEMREALRTIDSAEGKRIAEVEGLTLEKVASVTKALDDWEVMIGQWTPKTIRTLTLMGKVGLARGDWSRIVDDWLAADDCQAADDWQARNAVPDGDSAKTTNRGLQLKAASKLTKMKALSDVLHDALTIVRTPTGQVAAKAAKLETTKVAEIGRSLAKLDVAIARQTTPAK